MSSSTNVPPVALSAKHLKDLHLPDKAIDVLDEAGAAQKLLPADQRPEVIGPEQIEAVVAKMARVKSRQAICHVQGFVNNVMVFQGDIIGVPFVRDKPTTTAEGA